MRLLLALVFIPILSFAQVKYGKVVKSDFDSVALSGEKDVDAIVLYKKDHTYFTLTGGKLLQTNSVHERILIKTEEGLDYATQKVILYNQDKGSRENLKQVHAAAYNLNDNKVEESKLSRRDIFEEELNEFWRTESFTIPGAKVGSIIEFEYKKTSYLFSIDDKILQYDIPINELDLKVVTHEYLNYNCMANPQSPYLSSKLNQGSGDQIKFNKTLSSYDKTLEGKLSAIPSLIKEPYSGNQELYRAKLLFELSGVSVPGEVYKSFSNTWEDVSKSIYEHSNFGKQLGKSRYFRDELAESVSSSSLDLANAYNIINFLKSKVKWNGSYGKYTDKGVKNAYKDGAGNVADINLLLVNMLTEKGFTAYPVLISSENNGIPIHPTLDGFDYVIVDLIINDEHFLIDATEPFATFNVLPERSAHWLGRLLYNSENSEWLNVEPKTHSKDILFIDADLNEELQLNYEAKRRLTQKMALITRSSFSDLTKDDISKKIEGDHAGLTVTEHDIKHLDSYNMPLDVTYSGVYENGVKKIGDKLYVSPLLYNGTDENLFKSEIRQLPIDFRMPMESKTIANITVPEGYEIQTLPQSIKSVYQDGVGSYSFLISQTGNRITTISEFKLDNPLIMPEDYQAFREFFIAIVNKDAEKIILNKKS